MDVGAVMKLNSTGGGEQFAGETTATARKLVNYLPITERERKTLLTDRIASKEFVLCKVPNNRLAVVENRDIMAAVERMDAPIVVDINKNSVGASRSGYIPPVIVVEGTTRLRKLRDAGAVKVLAWVGAEALKLFSDIEKVPTLTSMLPVEMDDRPRSSIASVLANAGSGGGYGGATGSSGPAGLGSTSLNYGSSGDMDKIGLSARKSMKVPPNPAAKINANFGVADRAGGGGFDSGMSHIGSGGTGMRSMPNPSPGSGVGPRVMPPGREIRPLSAEAARIKKIVTKYKKALAAGSVCPMTDDMMASAPPGMEKTVKGLKKHFGKDNASPYKIAWWMHNQQKGIKGCGG